MDIEREIAVHVSGYHNMRQPESVTYGLTILRNVYKIGWTYVVLFIHLSRFFFGSNLVNYSSLGLDLLG